MEDKKRLFDAVETESEPPAKKLDHLSEKGPLTQLDVVYFKKEAIWRQMNFYKLQVNELTREVASYEKQVQRYIAAHQLLESWYKQVVAACGVKDAPELDLTASSDAVHAVLDAREQMLARILQPVAENADSAVLDVVRLEAEKNTADAQRAVLQEQLTELQSKIQALQKLADRQQLATLQRVLNDTRKHKEEEPVVENGKVELEETASAATAELEQLRIEHAQVKAGYAALEAQLADAAKELSTAIQEKESLMLRLKELSDADLAKCPRYVALVDQNKTLADSATHANKLKDELVERVRELEDSAGDVLRRVDRELADENKLLKETLARTEADLVRIRTVRDELLAKQTLMKLEMDSRKTNEELQRMNSVLHERLRQLEETRSAESTDAAFDAMEHAELVRRLQILSGEMKDMEQAFQDTRAVAMERMKEAVDHESLIKKLSIEKTKADQKYFASMRVKDALAAENKVLKTQIAKLQELVAKLNDLEKSYLNKIDLLTKSVNDLRLIKEGSIHETAKLHETVKQMGKSREGAVREIHLLKEEVAALKLDNAELTRNLKARKVAESKTDAKLRATESLLLKYKLNNTLSILQEDEKQLEALRAITKCSVCLKNWKNTAITACGHVFCESCVQERLAARLRRCPTCNKGFSANDLLSVHL